MKRACLLIIWGIIFSRVHIRIGFFDLLMDPLGYMFIFAGLGHIINEHKIVSTARIYATLLIFLSIPSVLIPFETNQNLVGDFWYFYLIIAQTLDIILFFYIFKSLIEILTIWNHEHLLNKTKRLFIAYISIHLVILLFHTFTINLAFDAYLQLFVISTFVSLIMEIILIVFLLNIRHIELSPVHNNEEEG